MIDTYIKEFLGVAGFLVKSGKITVRNGYILVSRPILDKLLARNAYETIENKLRIWKRLHWIDADMDRYTKKVSIEGRRVRVVKIDEAVYQTLFELYGE